MFQFKESLEFGQAFFWILLNYFMWIENMKNLQFPIQPRTIYIYKLKTKQTTRPRIICVYIRNQPARPRITCVFIRNQPTRPRIICVFIRNQPTRPRIICVFMFNHPTRPGTIFMYGPTLPGP